MDNPVVILLEKRSRVAADGRLGWLGRPVFLLAVYFLMLAACYLIWEQYMLLERQSPLACSPLYANSARVTVFNCLLLYYAAVGLLLAISRGLSALSHSILFLAPLRDRSVGLQLDELRRSAPISDLQVLGGLVWYHLRGILAALALPLSVLAYVIATFIADGHLDRSESLWQPDFLLALLLPLLTALLCSLLVAGLIMLGVFIGSRIRWPLFAHCAFWLICAGLLFLLKQAGGFVLMYCRALDLLHSERQVWIVYAAVGLLGSLLLIRIFSELGLSAIGRLSNRPELREPGATGSSWSSSRQPLQLANLARRIQLGLLAIPLLCGLALCGYSLCYKASRFSSADPLQTWFHEYLQESLRRQLIANPVCAIIPSSLAPLSTLPPGAQLRSEPDLLEAAAGRFAEDYRWQLLRMDLLESQPDPSVIANSRGATSNRELADMLLAGLVPAAVEQPDCRLVYLRRGLIQLNELKAYYSSSHLDEGERDPDLLARLQDLRVGTQREIIELARQTMQAYPLYLMAMNVEEPDWDSWLKPMAEADELPFEQFGNSGTAILAAEIAAAGQGQTDPLAMAMLADNCFINSGGYTTSFDWYFTSYTYNLSLITTPHELSHINRMLYRSMLAEDSGPPEWSWVLDCLCMTSDWMLHDPNIDEAGHQRLLQMREQIDYVDAEFRSHAWFRNNPDESRRYRQLPQVYPSYFQAPRERYPALAELLSLGRSKAILDLESRWQFRELQNHLSLKSVCRQPLEELIGMDFLGVQWERWDPNAE